MIREGSHVWISVSEPCLKKPFNNKCGPALAPFRNCFKALRNSSISIGTLIPQIISKTRPFHVGRYIV